MSKRSRETAGVVAVERPRQLAQAPAPEPRRPARKRRGLATACLMLLLAGSIAGLGWAVQSDAFRIGEVRIEGASPALQQAIEDSAAPGCPEDVPGVVECPPGALGPNELTFSADLLRRELEQMPLVKSATVKPQLPNRLDISVVERHPEAAWLVGTQTFRVADDGTVMDQGPAQGLKVAIGQVGGEAAKPGDRIPMDVIKGAELLQDQLPNKLGIAAKRIQYSPEDGLAVIGDQDMIAMFGQPQDLDLKMAELQRIVQLAKDKKVTLGFVDLRYKTPYFRAR